jgi:hypothetical protein
MTSAHWAITAAIGVLLAVALWADQIGARLRRKPQMFNATKVRPALRNGLPLADGLSAQLIAAERGLEAEMRKVVAEQTVRHPAIASQPAPPPVQRCLEFNTTEGGVNHWVSIYGPTSLEMTTEQRQEFLAAYDAFRAVAVKMLEGSKARMDMGIARQDDP